MYNLVGPIVIDFNHDKVRRSYLPISLMDRKIFIWEKGKWDRIGLFVYAYLIRRISRANADYLNSIFKV